MKRVDVFVVIMAGGGGTRFWPWSREVRPKQLLPVLSERSMIRETFDRVLPMAPPEKIFVVTSRTQASRIGREVPQIPALNIIAEPVGRNTAPCLCLAALAVRQVSREAVMVVLPADHAIAADREYLRSLRSAAGCASREDLLVTVGIRPTGPETGYGYIQKGEALPGARARAFKARAFREKPTLARAREYLRRGDYLWNSGMFVWRTEVFLRAMKEYLPELYGQMQAVEQAWGTPRQKECMERAYRQCEAVSVDYGIMEKAPNVAVVEGRFSWSDVGSWAALWGIRPKDGRGNAPVERTPRKGKVLAVDSSGCLIRSEEKLVAVLGMKDTVVVESGNAFLVCPRSRSQEVRRILEELKKKGWSQYL